MEIRPTTLSSVMIGTIDTDDFAALSFTVPDEVSIVPILLGRVLSITPHSIYGQRQHDRIWDWVDLTKTELV